MTPADGRGGGPRAGVRRGDGQPLRRSLRGRSLRAGLVLAAVLLVVAGNGAVASAQAADEDPFRILVYTRTTGFRHLSIPLAIDTVRELGAQQGFAVDTTEDPAAFTDENLARYAAVMFLLTTGTVLDRPGKEAFERYVRAGGGWAGVHSAADTEYDWPFYGELLGGAWFHSHPVQQPGIIVNEAPDQPSTGHLPGRWLIPLEEFYSFVANPRPEVRVLLSIDESSYLQDPNFSIFDDPPFGETGVMGDHPMSWCRDIDAGRAWYTALGHEHLMYLLPAYQQHLLGGILTAAGRVEADCSPPSGPAPAERAEPAGTGSGPSDAGRGQDRGGALPTAGALPTTGGGTLPRPLLLAALVLSAVIGAAGTRGWMAARS